MAEECANCGDPAHGESMCPDFDGEYDRVDTTAAVVTVLATVEVPVPVASRTLSIGGAADHAIRAAERHLAKALEGSSIEVTKVDNAVLRVWVKRL